MERGREGDRERGREGERERERERDRDRECEKNYKCLPRPSTYNDPHSLSTLWKTCRFPLESVAMPDTWPRTSLSDGCIFSQSSTTEIAVKQNSIYEMYC